MHLSLIIPVYNVEAYLEECLDSCLEQDIPHSDYEIIAINDGSPDGSLAILERYAAKYPNITVLSQENRGLSATRNRGIEVAKGEYIWFIDSDDWIEKNCLSSLLGHTEDMVMFGGMNTGRKGQFVTHYFNPQWISEITELLMPVGASAYLYRRDFIIRNISVH
ncbi:glycosyltransferase involved in cell wall biosynthesis [Parabacteroides sp. PFB2-10]|uniref:glycosyltransferase family 2 protein n=1 Tax=Parabacteroides sp. PFB2-10 TaxID=1742405 RepID=UPI002472FC9F|nr:glycosyltransferase family 2 protein [Parabacteroides sp. PFB2-10]MDH6314239.1 glycosyltransferase involved in cell wall biosynthesis [Parabacteroides sp. PFB2-10]MDL2244636.1 glycosyltransferase [Parabacteroides sp. OttesenSCG-928-J18]